MIATLVVAAAALMMFSANFSGDPEPERFRLYTFVVDPMTFLVVGLVSSMVGFINLRKRKLTQEEFRNRQRVIDALLIAFMVGFWTFETLTYFNVLGHPFDPLKTGNDFMWNGYVEWLIGPIVDTTVPTYRSVGMNVLACVGVALQYGALRLGRYLGSMIANRSMKTNS